ncbi:MAG: rhombosortase [Candidatus Methylomirabilales bacterium]
MTGSYHNHLHTAARRLPRASPLCAAAAVVVYALPSVTAKLQYDRLAIAAGEIWRMLSCHWTHASSDHLFWDVLTFLVLGTLCERMSRMRFCACVLASTVLIPVALWITIPHLETYRGLSGIDSALYVLLAVTLLKDEVHGRQWRWVMALSGVLLLFIGKVGYEVATGGTIFVDSRAAYMVPVPLAHCVGAAVGMIVGLMRIPNWLHTP